MPVGTWKIYTRAKRKIGTGGAAMTAGGVTLGVGVFKMCLLRASASAAILKVSNAGISTWAQAKSGATEIVAQGGYAANGRTLGAQGGGPAGGKWTVGASAKQMKFTYSTNGLAFTASGAALSAIKYCCIRTSSGASTGQMLCYVTLSTAAFSIASPNILTIIPAATGVFTLA